ncbi:hypothetical protein VTO42DRAFT_103 [Malbranchea cinnamomea]
MSFPTRPAARPPSRASELVAGSTTRCRACSTPESPSTSAAPPHGFNSVEPICGTGCVELRVFWLTGAFCGFPGSTSLRSLMVTVSSGGWWLLACRLCPSPGGMFHSIKPPIHGSTRVPYEYDDRTSTLDVVPSSDYEVVKSSSPLFWELREPLGWINMGLIEDEPQSL